MSFSPKLQQLLQKEGISFTALDVHKRDFDKGRILSRHYDANQVDVFLDQVVKDYERFYKLLDEMHIEIEALREAIASKDEISVERLHVRLRLVEHFLQNNR